MLKSESYDSAIKKIEAQVIAAMQKQGNNNALLNYVNYVLISDILFIINCI